MKKLIMIFMLTALFIFSSVSFYSCAKKEDKKMTQELINFIRVHEAKVKPIFRDANLAYFNATTTGRPDEYKKLEELQIKLNKIYTNKEEFATLKRIKESGGITDEKLKRQLEVLYLSYLANQIDEKLMEEMTKMGVQIENKFSTFRAVVDGKKLTDNDIEDILTSSTDSKLLQKAWEASKIVGQVVSDDVKKLVKKRNEVAKTLGFKNYHEMSLKLSEQDPEEIAKLFDELDELTRGVFTSLKGEIDSVLAKKLKLKKEELMPWHYQNRFFQEAPKIYTVDLDAYYKDKNIEQITADYYAGLGMPIDDMLKKSDLYERENKYQHAYCTNIDREGDVRVVCNIKPNSKWMNTMLHEFGHAVYEKYMDKDELPWLLRSPAHTFTTEAIAMLFGRMASNPRWMQDVIGLPEAENLKIADASFKTLKLEELVFSRWAQVMFRFEKSMYENPEQDLNKLWWDLVEKYQMIKRPAGRNMPDWASKIHIASYPCYYHNYLLGALLASQFNHYVVAEIIKSDKFNDQSYNGNKEVGKFFIDKVFRPGALLTWNEMIKQATGEYLKAKYYAMQFVN